MNPPVFKRRIYVAGALIILILFIFTGKLIELHFSNKIILPPDNPGSIHRGEIKDRNGSVLAMSIEKQSLFANPSEIKEPSRCASSLASILSIPQSDIERKLEKKKKFVWIKRKIEPESVNEVKQLGIKGLYFKNEDLRVYPHDSCSSNILGFVGIDNRGLDGIEFGYDSILTRNPESPGGNGGARGFGYTLVLTLDRAMQSFAEQEIDAMVKRLGARQGMVCVMEVKTGRIRALAKAPRFDPNDIRASSIVDRKNFTVTDSFEPGSTMKVIALAAMMINSPSALKKTATCRGSINIAGENIGCTHVHGVLALPDIIKLSCNVGVFESMKPVKKNLWYETLRRFGFGSKTGTGIPGESEGILRPVKEWSALTKYSTAIGQEVSVTSLQLVAAFSAIANGGIYITPSILERVETYDGTVVKHFAPRVRGRVLDAEKSKTIMKIMRSVVEGGTGTAAASMYYDTVGKTGTSQKYMRGKGYSDKVIASFIGIAPYRSPSLCILVVIDDPADRRVTGGAAATPVFATLIDRCLALNGIKQKGVIAREPIVKKKKPASYDNTMPDFRGMGLSEVIPYLVYAQRRHGAAYSLSGEGIVHSQAPAPGTIMKKNMKIELHFR